MLSTDIFYIGENNKEILPVEKGECPFVCRYSRKDSYLLEEVPWHWHNALEISFVEEGEDHFQSTENYEKLEPGDVIATGTPAGIGPMAAGDVAEVEIQGIGILRTKVI